MKSHYELLGVEATVAPDEIKRAFRREIARYHPDKVQHLGPEFQEIAATRAAELTEAYRILMDAGTRHTYDTSLAGTTPAERRPAATHQAPPRAETDTQPAQANRFEGGAPDAHSRQTRATTGEVVRKAALARFKEAVASVVPGADAQTARGFDAAFFLKGKRSLFGKADPPLRLLARFVAEVHPAAVEEAWPFALAAAAGEQPACVLLLGAGMAPAGQLSAAVADQRRRSRRSGPVFVPVDVRDWDALFPADAAPGDLAPVRAILQRLKHGKG